MNQSKIYLKVRKGIFISEEMLSKANINSENVELEIADHEIRIRSVTKKNKRKILKANSPLWKCIGCAQLEGVNGRDHDKYISNEK